MRAKNILLIAASILFYAYGEPVYVVLMLASSVLNYVFGMVVVKRKSLLVLSVALNLGILCVFKYTDMIVASVNGIFGTDIPLPEIALPIGISFYTFQAMSYVIDVYRENVKPQRNYLCVLLYISFFPQLIAGPIVKYHDIEHQMEHRETDMVKAAGGFRRFVVGLSKKVLISNVIAVAADSIFSLDINYINIVSAWLGAISYMLQIYYDFSGYSDMAIGLGQMFGFTFLENFDHPYAARSVKEFWRKWHISLSTWFREYLYIPLGGNRKGRARAWINRLIVFFFTGLWHGANWTFVLWGLYHGFFLFLEDVTKDRRRTEKKVLSHLYLLLVVCIGFVMFRADTVSYGIQMIAKMFTGWSFDFVYMQQAYHLLHPLFLFTLLIALIGQFPCLDYLSKWVRKSENQRLWTVWNVTGYVLSFGLLVLDVLSLSGGTYNPFIYFRF